MKKHLIAIYFILVWGSGFSQSLFQNAYGPDAIYKEAFASSPDAYYLWQDILTPNYASYLFKINLNGSVIWKKQLSFAAAPIGGFRVFYNNNNIYLTGGYQNAGYRNFFAKLDTSGNVLWTSELNYGDININSRIIPVPGGGMLTTGHRDYIGSASSYTFDITLSRFDDAGTLLWAKAIGNNSYEFLCNAAVLTTNNDLITVGNYGLRTPSIYDPMIARFDSSGNLLWMKLYQDTTGFFTEFTPSDVVPTSDGNFVMTGYSENTNFNYDPQVIKFDGNGNIIWAKRLYQISWQEYGLDILVDSQNNIVVAGNYSLSSDKGNFFATLDNAGNLLGSVRFKGTSNYVGSIYEPHGQHLLELPGFGYSYGSQIVLGSGGTFQCVLSGDYFGTFSCTAAGAPYPFSIQDATWFPTTFTNLPSASTAITGSFVTFNSVGLSGTEFDICPLVGLQEMEDSDISKYIYPNPVTEQLHISGELFQGQFEIMIFDVQGRIISTFKVDSSNTPLEVNTSALAPGIYHVRITGNNDTRVGQFIKSQP